MNGTKRTLLIACFALAAPLFHGLVTTFVSSTTRADDVLFPVFILAGVGYLGVGLICLGVGIIQAIRRRWGSALRCAIIPAVTVMFVVFPSSYGVIEESVDYIHFAAFSRQYARAVDAASRTDGLQFQWFFWRDASAQFGETLVYLVFDESDGFALPEDQRSATWMARALSSLAKLDGYAQTYMHVSRLHHLFGHYYVVTLDD